MQGRFANAARMAVLAALLSLEGCSSCEPPPPPTPQPVPQEGKLPRAPEPAAVAYTPVNADPSCVVVASIDVDEGPAPLKVQLTAEGMCTDAEGIYEWDFGDGSPVVQGATASHVYAKPGTYTAIVKLIDSEHNAQDTDETPIVVSQP